MSDDRKREAVLCVDFAGDETISKEVHDTLKDAGFEVKRVPMSGVSRVGDGWSLIVQLGLSKNPNLGREFLGALSALFPGIPKLVLSGHLRSDEGVKVEALGAKYLTRTCSTIELVNTAYKLISQRAPQQRAAE
jgi:hypothetical protein